MNSIAAREVIVNKWNDGQYSQVDDIVAEEIRIQIFVNKRPYGSLVCSPWNLEELVIGYLYFEGVISSYKDVSQINVSEKNVFVSCIEGCENKEVNEGMQKVTLSPETVSRLIGELETSSDKFKKTGGVHNAALSDGQIIITNTEDVSRHNALDRLAGRCLIKGIPFEGQVVVFSGRVPEEIITNVAAMKCGAIISVSAPTSRAIEIAEKENIMLICFARGKRFNVYAHADRLKIE